MGHVVVTYLPRANGTRGYMRSSGLSIGFERKDFAKAMELGRKHGRGRFRGYTRGLFCKGGLIQPEWNKIRVRKSQTQKARNLHTRNKKTRAQNDTQGTCAGGNQDHKSPKTLT